MIYPKIEEVKKIANTGEYNIMPICTEILSDIKTSVEVMKILMNISQHCYMLESAADNENWGRYTFWGYAPKMEITCVNALSFWKRWDCASSLPKNIIIP